MLVLIKKFKLILFLALIPLSGFSCINQVEQDSNTKRTVELKVDTCDNTPTEIVIRFHGKPLSPDELKDQILGYLNSEHANKSASNFKGKALAQSLMNSFKKTWKVGRYDSIFCLDATVNNFACSHYALMLYRTRKGKNIARVLYNNANVQFN